MYKSGKQDQLKEFAKMVDDKALGTLMGQLGFEGLDRFKFGGTHFRL
jgi:hypothetical protein